MKARYLILGMLAIACNTGAPRDFGGYPTPESIFDAAMAAYRTGDCNFAEQAFARVQADYPARDGKQAEARFYIAECRFQRNLRLEAARLFRRVTDEFPRHPLAPDALLRAGDAYSEMWSKADLDPTYGETALATYQELLQRFRGAPAADRARLRIADLNEMMARKEYRNGVFYMRLRAFDSAIIYFKDVVAKYPQSSFASKAVTRLVEAYHRIGYVEEKAEMCQYLARYYPEDAGAELCSSTAGNR